MDTKKLIEEVLLAHGNNKSLTDVSSKIQIIVRNCFEIIENIC